jgi:2-iminoacetate synthase ThiH
MTHATFGGTGRAAHSDASTCAIREAGFTAVERDTVYRRVERDAKTGAWSSAGASLGTGVNYTYLP